MVGQIQDSWNNMSRGEPNTTRQLEQAFDIFNRMSDQLGSSYRELESRVATLTEELTAARSLRLKELAEKERLANRLSALLEVLPVGVVILDSDEKVREANPGATGLLGNPLIGVLWADVLARESVNLPDEAQEVELQNGKRIILSERVLDAQGNQVILLTDVTDRHALQEWVNREKRLSALGEMVARLAHQIRTPLSSALLYMSHFSTSKLDDVQRSRVVNKISDRLKHMERLVNSMLNFVRGGSAGSDLIPLSALLDELKLIVAPQVLSKGGDVRFDFPIPNITIKGNKEALLAALVNITENAINIVDVPFIDITARNTEQWTEIYIRDNGPGIDPSVIDRIFDPFFTTRAEGTGLGLAVVAMTAKAHGGDVQVFNHDQGGAEFRLRLSRSGADKTNSIGLWSPSLQQIKVSSK